MAALQFNPYCGFSLKDDDDYVWFVLWRSKSDNSSTEMVRYTFAQLKAMFPHGQARDDLKRYVALARKRYSDRSSEWVKIDGARKDTNVTLAVDTGLVWPVLPYHQEGRRKCAFNAVRNIGYDLPPSMELDDLRSIVNYLMSNNIARVLFFCFVCQFAIFRSKEFR